MILKEKIEGVASFAFLNGQLHVMKALDLFAHTSSALKKIASFDSHMQELHGGAELFINDINGKGYLIHEGRVLVFDEYILNILNDHRVLAIAGRNTVVKVIQTNEQLWLTAGRDLRFIIEGETLFRRSENSKIQAMDLTNGNIRWDVDMAQGLNNDSADYTGAVSKFIGTLNNIVYVAVRKSIIIGLDLSTGATQQYFYDLKGFSAGGYFANVLPDTTTFVLDKDRKILFSLFNEFYTEIDLTTDKISFKSLKPVLSKYKMLGFKAAVDVAFDNKCIYAIVFMDKLKMKKDWMMMSLVTLNRITFEIEQYYTFEESVINTDVPLRIGNSLYQLDSEKALHVFEM
jgi:hypothetical protein